MLMIHFTPKGMNEAKYAEVMRRLDRAGAAAPHGRLHHACYGSKDALQVVDVYDTMASFEAFGKTLMPILAELQIDVGRPNIAEVHNVVRGDAT
jgi:hypothetical protein